MGLFGWGAHGTALGLVGASCGGCSEASCQARREQSPRNVGALQAAAACEAALAVVVQHHAIGCLVVAHADVVVELSKFLAEGYQLVLRRVQHPLTLRGRARGRSQLGLQARHPLSAFTVAALQMSYLLGGNQLENWNVTGCETELIEVNNLDVTIDAYI